MDYTARLDMLSPMINGIPSWDTRRDLAKLHNNLKTLAKALSVAAVDCRRLKHPTATFTVLDAQFDESYAELEQWITFAMLL